MSNYELMENFLNEVKQLVLDNKTRNINPKVIYSLLIRYNIPNLQDPFEKITDKFPILYQYFQNKPNIRLYEIKNFNFLNFKNGKVSGNEIKLYLPYDKNHIVVAAQKIFDFMAYNNIEHLSKIAHYIRNDDFVIRVNTLEDANQIIKFIKNDAFLTNNLLQVNPFLPNNDGIGMAMDNNFSFNLTLCEIISELVFLLKAKNRINDLNIKVLNAYILECIPSVANLDKRDIYRLLGQTTRKDFKIEQFYEYADEKLNDVYDENRVRIIDPAFYLKRAVILTEKYRPGNTISAIKKYINGNIGDFVLEENGQASLVKYVPSKLVMPLIEKHLRTRNISFSSGDDAIFKYVQNILNKNISQDLRVDNEVKNPISYLEEAIKITEKYHPGFGVPALIDYINIGKINGFTRKENARANLISNVSPSLAMRLIKNDLKAKNLVYSNDIEAIRVYVNEVLGLNKVLIRKSPAEYLQEAIRITEKYHPGFGIPALIDYINLGKNTGFTRKEMARENLTNNVPNELVMDLVSNYLNAQNITYYNLNDAVTKYVNKILGIEVSKEKVDFDLDLIIGLIKNAYLSTRHVYNTGQANLALRHLLMDGDLFYFTDQFGDRNNLLNISSQYDLRECIIRYLGEDYAYATVEDTINRMTEVFDGRRL